MPTMVRLINLPFAIIPGETGEGEEKIIHLENEKSDTIYQIPLDEKSINYVVEHLKMSNEELSEQLKEK